MIAASKPIKHNGINQIWALNKLLIGGIKAVANAAVTGTGGKTYANRNKKLPTKGSKGEPVYEEYDVPVYAKYTPETHHTKCGWNNGYYCSCRYPYPYSARFTNPTLASGVSGTTAVDRSDNPLRIVIDTVNKIWYITVDHYKTFLGQDDKIY